MKKLSCMAALLATCFSAQAGWATTDLGSLGGTSFTKGISIYNRAVGGSTNVQETLYAPFTATPAGIQALNVPGMVAGEALAANASGQVVGNATKANGSSSAFLYSDGIINEIAHGGYATRAAYINHAGQVAGTLEAPWDQPFDVSGFLYSSCQRQKGQHHAATAARHRCAAGHEVPTAILRSGRKKPGK